MEYDPSALRLTIGGMEFRGFRAIRVDPEPSPLCPHGMPTSRAVPLGTLTCTVSISREDHDRLRAMLMLPWRRHLVRRQLWARTMSRERVRS